jgi:hypothetical protein
MHIYRIIFRKNPGGEVEAGAQFGPIGTVDRKKLCKEKKRSLPTPNMIMG